jgi:hypothetical protein
MPEFVNSSDPTPPGFFSVEIRQLPNNGWMVGDKYTTDQLGPDGEVVYPGPTRLTPLEPGSLGLKRTVEVET